MQSCPPRSAQALVRQPHALPRTLSGALSRALSGALSRVLPRALCLDPPPRRGFPVHASPRRAWRSISSAMLALASLSANPLAAQDAPITRDAGVVVVNSGRPSSLPTIIPATMEGITARDIDARINALNSEDTLRYFPSLLVRKRYIGDYNHAMLSSRASGTGNPARSMVYADGVLLSNFLGNGVQGLGFPPRWSMVNPAEIERVDVMYGPYSAAYPGNSAGAVVEFVTRMPASLEAYAGASYVHQPFTLYRTDDIYRAWRTDASLGNRQGPWSWLISASRLDSTGQPQTFATRTLSTGTAPSSGGVVVNGAVAERNTSNADIAVIGSGTQYATVQDHLTIKLAYDFSPTTRMTYLAGVWQNDAQGRSTSYLRHASNGAPVNSGPIIIDGRQFAALSGADFPLSSEDLVHQMHSLTLKTTTGAHFDWSVSASLYDYTRDSNRRNAASNTLPAALSGGAGTLARGDGTGWNNLAVRGTWRPGGGADSTHTVDLGYQRDSYLLDYATFGISGNWLIDPAGAPLTAVGGRTRMDSFFVQDAWRFAPAWLAVLGLRTETWNAREGFTRTADPRNPASALLTSAYPAREDRYLSPKAAVSYQIDDASSVKFASGRAVRMPTVFELYGNTATTNAQYLNDPQLRPERIMSAEWSYERSLTDRTGRLTYFQETTQDGIYSQSVFDPILNGNITRVTNVGRIETRGAEAVIETRGVAATGLDLLASVSYAHSLITANAGFVALPGDTIGKRQPNIPRWRATLLGSYRLGPDWTVTLAARYSGEQFRTLHNADVNGFTYMGVSRFLTVDLRALYRIDNQWTLALGVDNLNNFSYWNFHPYPQRSFLAHLRYAMGRNR